MHLGTERQFDTYLTTLHELEATKSKTGVFHEKWRKEKDGTIKSGIKQKIDTLYSQITRQRNLPGGHGMHFDSKAAKSLKLFTGGRKVPVGQGTL